MMYFRFQNNELYMTWHVLGILVVQIWESNLRHQQKVQSTYNMTAAGGENKMNSNWFIV